MKWFNHTQATLRFGGIAEVELAGFNNQNAILDLHLEEAGVHPEAPGLSAYRVTIEPAFGLGGSFLCSSIEVSAVESGLPAGSVYGEQ